MDSQKFGEKSRQSLHDLAAALRQEREELSLQVGLGKMELRDEWEEVESKWRAFEHKVGEANEDAKHSLHEIGQEIAETYNKLKHSLG